MHYSKCLIWMYPSLRFYSGNSFFQSFCSLLNWPWSYNVAKVLKPLHQKLFWQLYTIYLWHKYCSNKFEQKNLCFLHHHKIYWYHLHFYVYNLKYFNYEFTFRQIHVPRGGFQIQTSTRVLPFPYLCANLPHCHNVLDLLLDQTRSCSSKSNSGSY